MTAGRPSGTHLAPEEKLIVIQEVVELDQRGRVTLPPRLYRHTTWLSLDVHECLMVMTIPRRLELMSWEKAADNVLERRNQIVEAIRNGEIDVESLRVFDDRYHKLMLPMDRRPTLGNAAVTHLGQKVSKKTLIYVAGYPDKISLFSASYREAHLNDFPELLAGLP